MACGPVVEIQFADYIYPGYDQIVSEAARLRYRSAGEFTAPMTVRTPCGGGIFGGQTHSQSPEALFTHVCGLKTVIPSNPYDAKGLLIAAIEDDDPVIFLEPKRLYNGPFDGHHDRPVVPWARHPLGETPDGHYTVPLGQAAVRREGAAVTVLAYGTMVHVAQAAAAETGVDAEIIDLRTLLPLDIETIERSVKKTGRCVIVHEATRTSRLRRRAVGAGAGALLLPPGGADRARHRLGHALSARAGMGLLPRPRRASAARSAPCWRPEMGTRIVKLPDIGEGIAEAEIVAWHVKVGDVVREEQPLVDVMTDKATVEIPSPVAGTVLALGGEVGSTLAVGGELVRIEVPGQPDGAAAPAPRQAPRGTRCARSARAPAAAGAEPAPAAAARGAAERAAAPAGRAAARLAGGAAAGAGRGHRPAPAARQRPGRPHPARGSRRRAARRRRRRAGGGRARRPTRGRGDQGHRPAPPHRRADGRGDAAHRAFLLCRGGRRHRARGTARRAQRRSARRSGRS